MEINATEPREIEHLLRKDPAISNDYGHIRSRGLHPFGEFVRANLRWLFNRQTSKSREGFDRRWSEVQLPPGWPVGLCHDRDNVMSVFEEPRQSGDG